MRSFLRLFGWFRHMEDAAARYSGAVAELQDATTARMVHQGKAEQQSELRQRAESALDRAESELAFWKAKSATQDTEIQRLNVELLQETQKVADTMSIHAIGKRIFSKASEQPPPPPSRPLSPPPLSGRDLRYRQAQETRSALAKMWDELPQGPAQ